MRPRATQATGGSRSQVYCTGCGSYNPPMRTFMPILLFLFVLTELAVGSPCLQAAEDVQVEITTKGLGKEVVITQGTREWFMMVEVTPENTVIIRQEKDRDQYLVDESETHDRPLAPIEVDSAITDYVNSVKSRAQHK